MVHSSATSKPAMEVHRGSTVHQRTMKSSRTVDVLGILTIAAYGSWFYGFGVLLPEFSDRYNISDAALGGMYGITTLLSGVAALIFGRVLDQGRIGPVLRYLGPLGALLYAVSVLTTHPGVFVLCFIAGGGLIGGAGFYSLTQSLLLRRTHRHHVADITRLTIWGAFASPISIPLTEVIRTNWGLTWAVVVPALVVGVAFLASSFLADISHAEHDATLRASTQFIQVFSSALRHRLVVWLWVSGLASSVATSALIVYQIPLMRSAGLTASTAAVFAGARGIFQLLGRIPLVWLVQRVGLRPLWIISRGVVAVSCVVVVISGHFVLASLYVVLAGYSIGSLSALDGMVGREILPTGDLGALNGALSLSHGIASTLGLVVIGYLNELSNARLLNAVTLSGIAMVAVVLSLPLVRQRPVDQSQTSDSIMGM